MMMGGMPNMYSNTANMYAPQQGMGYGMQGGMQGGMQQGMGGGYMQAPTNEP